MRRMRASWVIVVGVVLFVAVVPPLRQQTAMQAKAVGLRITLLRCATIGEILFPLPWLEGVEQGPWDTLEGARLHMRGHVGDEWLGTFYVIASDRAEAYARRRGGSNAGVLLAAYSFSHTKVESKALRKAAEVTHAPALWAAYTRTMLFDLEREDALYSRLELEGVDPADQAAIAEKRRGLVEYETPQGLTPEQARPFLHALAGWRRADPENGFPVALEAWVLYGLHRDREALRRWQQAASYATINPRTREAVREARRFGESIGIAEPEAWYLETGDAALSALLSQGARMAVFEGRRAQIGGRPQEAIALWKATVTIGRKLERWEFWNAIRLQRIGTEPAWQWYALDRSHGRAMYGSQHAFYVSQAGSEADAALRDALVRNHVRTRLLIQEVSGSSSPMVRLAPVEVLLVTGGLMGLQAALLLLLHLLWCGRARVGAEAAHRIRPIGKVALAGLVALPVPVLLTVLALRAPEYVRLIPLNPGGVSLPALVLAAGASLVVRRRGLRQAMDQVVPLAAALLALSFLVTALVALPIRAGLARDLRAADWSWMKLYTDRLGANWSDPTIPRDSWRAEYPPSRPSR